MGKKAKSFNSGDFIFAKVKGYPAWPARVQSYNGKKYCVYFYGTGETANLPANMIFDYEENKAKFLTKSVKRRDFNEGVQQIELHFANKTPLEEIIGPFAAEPAANNSANDSAISIDDTLDNSALDTTANDTVADTSATTQNDTAVEDSDEAGALVIDERKPAAVRKTCGGSLVAAKVSRGRQIKRAQPQVDSPKEMEVDETDKDEERVSRSGRKIRPKRFVDEQTEENATLPPSKKRKLSTDKDKPDETGKKPDETAKKPDAQNMLEKTSKADYNSISLTRLQDLKEPFKPDPKIIPITQDNKEEKDSQKSKVTPCFGKKAKQLKNVKKQDSKQNKFMPPLAKDNFTSSLEETSKNEYDTEKCFDMDFTENTTQITENNTQEENSDYKEHAEEYDYNGDISFIENTVAEIAKNDLVPITFGTQNDTQNVLSVCKENAFDSNSLLYINDAKVNVDFLTTNTAIVKDDFLTNQNHTSLVKADFLSNNTEIVTGNLAAEDTNPTFMDSPYYIGLSQVMNDFIGLEPVSNPTFIDINYTDPNIVDFEPNNTVVNEPNTVNCKPVKKTANKNKSATLGGFILGSLNILNKEDCISLNISQELEHSGQSSVKNLSQERISSFCSVTSLNKTYKNLDLKSCENVEHAFGKETEEIVEGHKIPEGQEFIGLFKEIPAIKHKTLVAMSTILGDVGLDKYYSDCDKDFRMDTEIDGEEIKTREMILQMYPNENSSLLKNT